MVNKIFLCEIKLLKQPKHNSQSSTSSFYMSTKTGVKVQKFFWKQLRISDSCMISDENMFVLKKYL